MAPLAASASSTNEDDNSRYRNPIPHGYSSMQKEHIEDKKSRNKKLRRERATRGGNEFRRATRTKACVHKRARSSPRRHCSKHSHFPILAGQNAYASSYKRQQQDEKRPGQNRKAVREEERNRPRREEDARDSRTLKRNDDKADASTHTFRTVK